MLMLITQAGSPPAGCERVPAGRDQAACHEADPLPRRRESTPRSGEPRSARSKTEPSRGASGSSVRTIADVSLASHPASAAKVLTPTVYDANAFTPEFKGFLVKVEKA